MKIQESNSLRGSNNFDFVRVLAAILVLVGHSPALFKNKPFYYDPLIKIIGYPAHAIGLYIFFIISGFLITKSWESKKNTFEFIVSRILRIFPALLFTLICTTFILGPLLTSYHLSDYLTSKETYKHLLNITLFRIYYELPGVFGSNPYNNAVNGSIWSLSYEFTCYLLLILFGYFHFLKNKWFSLSIYVLAVILISFYKSEIELSYPTIPFLGINMDKMIEFFILFFSGSFFYLFRNYLTFNWITYSFIISLIIITRVFQIPFIFNSIIFSFLIFSLVFSRRINLNKFGKYGDFSYGIYLFAFPIQQIIAQFFTTEFNLLLLILISTLFTFIASFICWNLVEKPTLKLKKRILNLKINNPKYF